MGVFALSLRLYNLKQRERKQERIYLAPKRTDNKMVVNLFSTKIRSALVSSLLFLLGDGGSGFLGSLLESGLGLDSGEDLEVRVSLTDGLDGALLESVLDQGARDRAVDLEFLAERCTGDAEDLCHFLRNLFVALLVEEHVVVELVLDLDLGPALLLSLAALLLRLSSL